MKNFSKRFCMVRLVLLPLALALAMILSSCQSVQEKLAGLFDGSSSSSQGTPLGKEYDGQGGTAITLQPLPVPQSYEKAYSYRTDVADKAMSAFIKRREVDSCAAQTPAAGCVPWWRKSIGWQKMTLRRQGWPTMWWRC